jgi:hypothetical protein
MKFNDLLENLKEKYKIQTDCYEEELYETMKEIEFEEVKSGLDVEKHRWYETSTTVYKVICDDGIKFLGINCATGLFSESSSWEDLYCSYDFFEMEEIKIISYKKKGAK